jgi:C-terminal processing protease CtpA/Prc
MINKTRFLLLLALVFLLTTIAPVRATQSAAEPYVVTGRYEVTSPTAIESGMEVQVVMADIGSEVLDDDDIPSDPKGVIVGVASGTTARGTYRLNLPLRPTGPLFKLDKAATNAQGIGVYAIFYGDNPSGNDITKDDYFSGFGGSVVYSEELDQITGGKLFIWSPSDSEKFPSEYGKDGKLFTEDDPLVVMPRGWSVVDLDKKPFEIIRTGEPTVNMIEGGNALVDYSKFSYKEAWEKLYERGVNYYAFTKLKGLDWPAIKAKIDPLVAAAKTDKEFAEAMRVLVFEFDDTHTSVSPISKYSDRTISALIGEMGIGDMVITGDNQIVVKYVEPRGPADRAGLKKMAVIQEVDGRPAIEVLDETTTLYAGASTPWAKRYLQLNFFLRGSPTQRYKIKFENPGEAAKEVEVRLRNSRYIANRGERSDGDPTELVISAKILDSGIGYIRLRDFYSQRPLSYRLFKTHLKSLIDAGVTSLIIDDRDNPGGWSDMATLLAGFFYDKETDIAVRQSSDGKGNFKRSYTSDISPQTPYFDGPVAVLVNANSVSSGDFFAYYMKRSKNGFVVGDTPTAGAGGGIQSFKLPGGLDFQWAESPMVTLEGENLLEGKGVEPDILVPLTVESIRTGDDVVLKAAEAKLKEGGFKR